MYVIEVIPLKRGIQSDTLSYFSRTHYDEGSLIKIPIRNSESFAIVTKTTEVSTTKTALRAATFSLRKLPEQGDPASLSSALVKTAEELSTYNASSVGSVLFSLLPPEVRNGDVQIPRTKHQKQKEKTTVEVLQATQKERYRTYRSLVREAFVHGGSVLCVAPTKAEADELYTYLSSGIEERVILLTDTDSKKKVREAYTALEDFSKSKLIITIPSHALLERHDITTVILEDSRSASYRSRIRPYIDYRDALRLHSRYLGQQIIFGDLITRTEDEYKRRTEEYLTLGETPSRIEFKSDLVITHMKDRPDGSTPFKLFAPQVIDAIKDVRRKKGHIFLFAAHRGLAPVVACLDCGFIFRSEDSGAPYSLVRTVKDGTEERWFVSGTSGKRIRAADTCSACGSWRLRERGIGIQHVYDELTKSLDGAPITIFDHLTAGTYKKACFLRDTFSDTKGSIMIGTRMAVPYLHADIRLSVVTNMDALYATPTWRLEEENLALLLTLREKTTEKLIVQTRLDDDHFLKQAKQARMQSFYTEELELREKFNYPPYATFIHLTWHGPRNEPDTIEAEIKEILKSFTVHYYAAPPGSKGATTKYALIRKSIKDWPDAKLVSAIRTLPQKVRVVINPDRIV